MPVRPAKGFEADFGCGLTDFWCQGTESLATWLADTITGLSEFALSASEFHFGSELWDVSATEAGGAWLGMSVLVMFITSLVGITMAAIQMSGQLMKRALLGTALAFPATIFAIFIVGRGLVALDQFSEWLASRASGAGTLHTRVTDMIEDKGTVKSVKPGYELFFPVQVGDVPVSMAWVRTPDGGTVPFIPAEHMVTTEGVSAEVVIVFLAVMALGMILLTLALAFRTFAMMLLIAFAPLAFVLLPAKGGGVWVKRWIAAVTAMALAKPLMFGALALLMGAFSSVKSVRDPNVVPMLIGLVLVSLMPIMVYGFFSFIGAGDGGDNIGSRAGQSATSHAQRGAQSISRGTKSMSSSVTKAVRGGSGAAAGGAAQKANTPTKPARPGAGAGAQERLPQGTKPAGSGMSQVGKGPAGGPGQKPGSSVPQPPKPSPQPPPRSQRESGAK